MKTWCWIAVAVVALGCGDEGGEANPGDSVPAGQEVDAPSETQAGSPSGLTRDSFSQCLGIEENREELASIVGFEHDPDRSVQGSGAECIVRGRGGGFARIALAPAVMPSVSELVQGYDGEKSPVPEVGPEAVFVNQPLQPHVVFPMGRFIIDVDAENSETPSRQTMIRLANRFREILSGMSP